VAQACLDETIKYTKERKQFGQPLSKFQNTQFMLADMATKIEAARNLVYQAAITKEQALAGNRNANSTMASSIAKYFSTEICNEVAGKAVQLHGGYGYIKEYKVERMYRDCRVFTIYEGTSQVQQMVIAGQLLK
jgi:alkylation response protein AidB-like acyl-CoA dehydrogenase